MTVKENYKEVRKLSRGDVRILCTLSGYYTNGTAEQYSAMLKRCGDVQECDIVEIALDIAAHSETACIKFIDDSCLSREDFKLHIMHELASISRSYFELV